MTKKTAAIFLTAAMLISLLASCGGTSGKDDVQTTIAQLTEAEETTGTDLTHDLPDDLKLNGETINIWYFTKNSDVSEKFLDIQGELNGDIVDEALYYRNLRVEERLGCDLVFTDTGVASSDVGNEISKMIMTGSTEYDIFNVVQWNSAKYVVNGLYLNIIDMPYVDIEKPWWSAYYTNEMNIGKNSRYFLVGDISIDTIRCISCMYFNKNLFENYYSSPDDLYAQVLDGAWTLDSLYTYTEGAYKDLNGDTKPDAKDQFGLLTNNYNNIDIMYYGAGARATARDSDNLTVLDVNNPRTASVMEKIYALCYDNQGTFIGAPLDNTKHFNDGYALFLMGFLYSSELLRSMENDYGIIPPAKFDEEQENYSAVVHDIATLICLPQTCAKLDQCGAVLELMAYESWKDVTPAYYETAMKTKYTRDQASSQIIDIIHDNAMTDIAYAFGENFNSMGYIARRMISGKNSNFTSYYESNEAAALTKMQQLIDAFLNL